MSDYTVIAQPAGLDETDGTNWNMAFTRLLRNTERYAWGNWTLDGEVQVGTLGWFNQGDTKFQFASKQLGNLPIIDVPSSQDFRFEQGDVRQTTVGVDFKVPYKDPTTGTDVTVGLETKWDFSSKGSLSSQGSACGIAQLDNIGKVLIDRYDEILDVARANSKAHGDEIDQGFGMVTKVWFTDGCVNVGSRSDKSDFSIVGSVDGVAAMTGSDKSASLKGSYRNVTESTNVEQRIFPSKANTVATKPVAYAYEFSTFAGRVVIPRYVAPISSLNLTISNSGSYIANVEVTFDTPTGSEKREVTVTGGMNGQVTGIPLSATNMNITIGFVAGTSQFLRVDNPLSSWYAGAATINVGGWWPGSTHAEWA